VQAMLIQAQTKAKIAETSATQRTQQKQKQWEMGEQRKNAQLGADIKRKGVETRHELLANRLKALAE
jgi:ribosomal protein S8E